MPPLSRRYSVPRHVGISLLLGSLLINFFLLGLVAAPLLHPHPPSAAHGGPRPEDMIENLTQGLSPLDAAALRSIYDREQTELNEGHRGIETAMHDVELAIAKPTVDATEVQKALERVALAHEKIQTGMHALITQAAVQLSPEGRQIFAQNGLRPPGASQGNGMGRHGHELHEHGADANALPATDGSGPPP